MLENYSTFSEKNIVVKNTIKIDSEDQLQELISTLHECNLHRTFNWRGMNDAKLKLFNSCQRYYNRTMNNNDQIQYQEFIRNLVNYVNYWNNGTVQRYLESQDIINDVVSVMALMQHHGFPTPLLDFSEDPLIALYFASQDTNFDFNVNDIDNYSSLYAIDLKIKNLDEFNEQYQISRHPYGDQFAPLASTKLLVISQNTPEFKIGTSLNIINQSGLFVLL